MSDIKIIIATHKAYWMPEDKMYLPVWVGAEKSDLKLPYAADNTGDNISEKNKYYCELTGLYWAWKNIDADYIGLVHYRRHFCEGFPIRSKKNRVIKSEKILFMLKDNDILLPRPRNYLIETNYSQYAHAHHAIDLDTTRHIIQEKYPEYIEAFDNVMKKRTGHRFNMFIMDKAKLDKYCEWLFDILFELENRLDISTYNKNDQRVFGFVSERLLDVWLLTNNYSYRNIPYVFLEKQNWIKKGFEFVKRKFN